MTKKKNDPVTIGLQLPISEKCLEWIEARDPDLAKRIKEENHNWANQRP